MVLFYSTVCALYPNLYTGNLPSSTSPIQENSGESSDGYEMNITKKINKSKSLDYSLEPDLETTSEGLCDHIREIFDLSRSVFNDYQVKAMKKLLFRKSHPQV